jgi:hypothetical protein
MSSLAASSLNEELPEILKNTLKNSVLIKPRAKKI